MAPETLENTQTYNNKTDAWTFGITVWEMYSKGTDIILFQRQPSMSLECEFGTFSPEFLR